jgi:hypothetical protein
LKKHAKAGEIDRFLEAAAGYAGEACLPWPFARNSAGYGHVGRGGKHVLAHRLVCEGKWGPPEPGAYAAHLCGNGHAGCVNPHHLAWKTPKGNQADMVRHGRSQRGPKHYAAILTEDAVRFIRANSGAMKVRVVAKQLGVSPAAVYSVIRGASWAWVDADAS